MFINARAVLIVFIAFVCTGLLYFRLGAMHDLRDHNAVNSINTTFSTLLKQPNVSLSDIETTFQQLSIQYQRSAPALARLGELALQLGWTEKSQAVFEQAARLHPEKPAYQIQAFYAESLLHQGKLSPESLTKAVALNALLSEQQEKDPDHYSLMNILAIDHYFSHHYLKAIQQWQELLMLDESLSPERSAVLENAIHKCKEHLSQQSTTRFYVKLELQEALRRQLRSEDTVFIAIKAAELDMPPLYVMKCNASELPKEFVLDDSAAMIELPNFDRIHSVEVIAKLNQTHRMSSGKLSVHPGDNRVTLLLTGEKDV